MKFSAPLFAGRFRPFRFSNGVLPLVIAATLGASPATAVEITLQTSNDPVAGNDRPDDLYTAALAVDLAFAQHTWRFGERMFTDREREVRFDETYLDMTRELPEWAGWSPSVTAGVLHVGHGLLGQEAQNQVHRLVGSERVDLPYPAESHWYATGRIRLDRPLWSGSRTVVLGRLEAAAAPGFQSSLRARVLGDYRFNQDWAGRAGFGIRSAKVETPLLQDRVRDLGVTWDVDLSWRSWTLRYAYNDDGTESRQLTLAVRVGASARHPHE